VNGCQERFLSIAKFGFGGQESASNPPQSHMQNVANDGSRFAPPIIGNGRAGESGIKKIE